MASDLEFFRKFYSKEDAIYFGKILEEFEVHFSIEYPQTIIDSTFVGTSLLPAAIIKIRSIDFARTNELLLEKSKQVPDEELNNHILNTYGDVDLRGIITDQQNWTIEEIYFAKRILKIRGLEITEDELYRLDEYNHNSYLEGKSENILWLIINGVCATLGHVLSMILPIAGIGMGYYYSYGKIVDKNGVKHYKYDERTRSIGRIIFYGGIVFFIFMSVFIYYSDEWIYETEMIW